jgi:hypothetical protein
MDCNVCVGKHVRNASGVVTNCCCCASAATADDDGGGGPVPMAGDEADGDGCDGVEVVVADGDGTGGCCCGGAGGAVADEAFNISYNVKFKFRTASSASTARVKNVISDRLYMATIFCVEASKTGMADKLFCDVVYVMHAKTRISSTNTMGKKFCGDSFGVLLLLLLVLVPLCNNCIHARYNVHLVLAPRNGCNKLNNPMGGAVEESLVSVLPVLPTEDVMVLVAVSVVPVVFPVDAIPESIMLDVFDSCDDDDDGCCCNARNAIISAILSTFNNVTSLCIIQE